MDELKPPKHNFWGAGEPDCPRDIKAGNGELHTLQCKVCGEKNPPDEFCWNNRTAPEDVVEAARQVIEQMSDTYKARNGRDMGIQDESGEKCWIVPHEAIHALEAALQSRFRR